MSIFINPYVFNNSEYDIAICNSGSMWYSPLSSTVAMTWPTYAEVLATNRADESVWGAHWYNAWWFDYAQTIVPDYQGISSDEGSIWYSTLAESTAVTWPSYASVLASNMADESVRGTHWYNAWWFDYAQTIVPDYQGISSDEGSIWYSALDRKDAV